MGNSTAVPGAIRIGYAKTFGTTNSLADEVTFVTVNMHGPLFSRVSGLSTNESTQTLPKSPASAMIRSSSGAGAVAETAMIRGLAGSLLTIVIVAALAPKLVGWKRIGNAIESPAPTTIG